MASQSEPLSSAAIRTAERITMLHTPESRLMDRAAQAVAAECAGASRVALLVGRGNNGGDALLAGAVLAREGMSITGVVLGRDAHRRGLAELAEAGADIIEWEIARSEAEDAIAAADTVIDGIVGLGGSAGLRPDAQSAVAAIAPGTRVVSVDLPSGLDPDSGEAEAPHVRADTTVTFTAPKLCLALEPAKASAGRVVIADVGIDL